MSEPKHVFISYAHDDGKNFAEDLYEYLAPKLTVWMDSHSIRPGEEWSIAIERGLSGAFCIVAVLTPQSALSPHVRAELNRALNRKIRVVPLMVKTCDPPYFLDIYQHVDFTNPSQHPENFAKLTQQLLNLQSGKPLPDDFEPSQPEIKIQESTSSRKSGRLRRRIAGDLPPKVSEFKNREEQLQTLSQLIAQDTLRLVSIIGPAGRGKTTLVYKLLEDLQENRWPHLKDETPASNKTIPVDGIVYMSAVSKNGISFGQLYSYCIEMIGGADADALEQTMTQRSIDRKIDHLLKVLDKGFYIILLDNLETILEPSQQENSLAQQIGDPDLIAFFMESLNGLHSVKLIITSRESPFFDPQLQKYRKEIPLRKGLPTIHGIALLRALDESEDFVLRDKATDAQLAPIVDMVEGNPRALEVFAGIVNENPLSNLEEIIQDFLKHPRTLEELIQEGYKRLSVDERQVLEALAIFTSPVPVEAIQYLLEDFLDKDTVTRILLRLINIYMVEVVDRERKLVRLNAADRAFIYDQLPISRDGEHKDEAV